MYLVRAWKTGFVVNNYGTKIVAEENQRFKVRLQYLLKQMKPISIQQVWMQVPGILLRH